MHQNQTNAFFLDKIHSQQPDNQTLEAPSLHREKQWAFDPSALTPPRADKRDPVPRSPSRSPGQWNERVATPDCRRRRRQVASGTTSTNGFQRPRNQQLHFHVTGPSRGHSDLKQEGRALAPASLLTMPQLPQGPSTSDSGRDCGRRHSCELCCPSMRELNVVRVWPCFKMTFHVNWAPSLMRWVASMVGSSRFSLYLTQQANMRSQIGRG